MERLTERWCAGGIRIKGCSTLYPDVERKSAPMASAIARLAAYEDAVPLERAQELAQAEKDGRLVALPPVSENSSASQENLDVFELFLAIKWAHAAALMDENPEVSRLFHLSEIALNEKLECLVNGQSSSGPLTREEAEAALKKREEADNEAIDFR